MEYKLFLVPLLLWAASGQASGYEHQDDVSAATTECCPHYETRWDQYGLCVMKYGIVPVCDGSMRGCYYGNRFYKVGEVVQLIPSKCLKIVCSCVTVNSKTPRSGGEPENTGGEGQLVASGAQTVQIRIVHEGQDCGCCVHDGKLYPNGSVVNLNRHMCDPKVCVDGKWIDHAGTYYYYSNYYTNYYGYGHSRSNEVDDKAADDENPEDEGLAKKADESDRKKMEPEKKAPGSPAGRSYWNYYHCCYYYGNYYVHGEVIAAYNHSFGNDCYKIECRNGYVYTRRYSCCCIEDGEVYPCDSSQPLPSSDYETCHIRKCCDGFIETHHQPGCCFHEGRVYKPDQFVAYTSNYCQKLICRNGVVAAEDANRCCYVDGEYYTYNQIVELNADKCILKICIGTRVVDRSKDSCPCCMYNNILYINGSTISPSPCQTLKCVDGHWIPDCEPSTCHYCYVGSHFKTFDSTTYHYNAPCNHTLVQYGYSYYSYYHYKYYFIDLSFKKCSVPFNNVLSCPDQLTIGHNSYTKVVLSPGGSITVNGNPVTTLPYQGNNGLFIYEAALAFNVITFYGLVVQYGKGHNPSVRILTPTYNYNRLYGLCGFYNRNSRDDLKMRSSNYVTSSISSFVNSWRTRYGSCIQGERTGTTCSNIGASRLKEINSWCEELFDEHPCLNATLNESSFEAACVNYMCSCLDCEELECKTYILSRYATDCANAGGIIDLACNDTVITTTITATTTRWVTSTRTVSSTMMNGTAFARAEQVLTTPITATTTRWATSIRTASSTMMNGTTFLRAEQVQTSLGVTTTRKADSAFLPVQD